MFLATDHAWVWCTTDVYASLTCWLCHGKRKGPILYRLFWHVFTVFWHDFLVRNERKIARNEREIPQYRRKKKSVGDDLQNACFWLRLFCSREDVKRLLTNWFGSFAVEYNCFHGTAWGYQSSDSGFNGGCILCQCAFFVFATVPGEDGTCSCFATTASLGVHQTNAGECWNCCTRSGELSCSCSWDTDSFHKTFQDTSTFLMLTLDNMHLVTLRCPSVFFVSFCACIVFIPYDPFCEGWSWRLFQSSQKLVGRCGPTACYCWNTAWSGGVNPGTWWFIDLFFCITNEVSGWWHLYVGSVYLLLSGHTACSGISSSFGRTRWTNQGYQSHCTQRCRCPNSAEKG